MSSPAPAREVIPVEMDQHRVAWLTTGDGPGEKTEAKVWFASDGGKIYAALLEDSPTLQTLQAHPQLTLSFGKGNKRVRGPEILALAHILPPGDSNWARHLLLRKYWLLRLPFFWNRRNVLVEISLV